MALSVVQQHLWGHLSCLLGHSPPREEWNRACEHLAQDVLPADGVSGREQCSVVSDHYDLVINVCLPYIIQACKAVLSRRAAADPLDAAEKAVLHALHWLLLDETTPYCTQSSQVSRKIPLDYSAVELFVASMVPVALNLCANDFDEEEYGAWTDLWEPLISGMPPSVALLVQPCAQIGKRHVLQPKECAVWLDVAAVHSLSWSHWTEHAQVWSLLYLKSRVAVLANSRHVPLLWSCRSTPSSESSMAGSFPFAGPVHLEGYLEKHMLSFEVVADAITSMFTTEQTNPKVHVASVLLLHECIQILHENHTRRHDDEDACSAHRMKTGDGKGPGHYDVLFQKVTAALLELATRCGCHQATSSDNACSPSLRVVHLRIRNLFAVLCRINHKASGIYLGAFCGVAPVKKVLFCLRVLLEPTSASSDFEKVGKQMSTESHAFPFSGLLDKDDSGEGLSADLSVPRQRSEMSMNRKAWHNFLPDTAGSAGEFLLNLAGKSFRGQSSTRYRVAHEQEDRLGTSEGREKSSGRWVKPLLRKSTDGDLAGSQKKGVMRRKLGKSKSLTAKLPLMTMGADAGGNIFQFANEVSLDPDEHSFIQVEYNDAKLNAFILKSTLKPLVAQLAKVDLAAAANETATKDAIWLLNFAGKDFEEIVRSVLLSCLLTTRSYSSRKDSGAIVSQSSLTKLRLSTGASAKDDGDVFKKSPDIRSGKDMMKDNENRKRSFTLDVRSMDGLAEARERGHIRFRNFLPEGIKRRHRAEGRDSLPNAALPPAMKGVAENGDSEEKERVSTSTSQTQFISVPVLTKEDTEAAPRDPSLVSTVETYLDCVDCEGVHTGLLSVATLFQCTEVGSLPDANLVAAVMDMNCPAVARAAFLVECTMLVKDCREKRWSAYQVMESTPLDTVAVNFWQWGQAVGNKLREYIDRKDAAIQPVIVSVRGVDDKEVGLVCNESVRISSDTYQLGLIAVNLLVEIALFLAELEASTLMNAANLPRTNSVFNGMEGNRSAGHHGRVRDYSRVSSVPTKSAFAMVAAAAAAAAASRSFGHRLSSTIGGASSHAPVLKEELVAPVDTRLKSTTSSSNQDMVHLAVAAPSLGNPTISVESATSPMASASPAPRSMASVAELPSPQLSASFDLLAPAPSPWGLSSRSSSISSSFSANSGISTSTETSEASRRVSLTASHLSRHNSKLRFANRRVPRARFDSGRRRDRQARTDHSNSGSMRSSNGPDTGHLPWLDVVGKYLSDQCMTASGSCMETVLTGAKCSCALYKDSINLLTAVSTMYKHEREGVALQKKSRASRNSQSTTNLRRDLEERIAEGVSNVQGLGLDSHFVMDLDPMRKVAGSPLLGSGPASTQKETVSIINPGTVSSASVQRNRDQDKLAYVTELTDNLFSISHRALLASATAIKRSLFVQKTDVLWRQLLLPTQDLAMCAACLFLLAGIRVSEKVKGRIQSGLKATDARERVASIHKFMALWNCRHQVWSRADPAAQRCFKIAHTRIAISLPQPLVGVAASQVAYPPWLLSSSSGDDDKQSEKEVAKSRASSDLGKQRLKAQLNLENPVNSVDHNSVNAKLSHTPHCDCKVCGEARDNARVSSRIASLNLIQEASVDQLLDRAAAAAAAAAGLPSTTFPTSAEEYTSHRRNAVFPPSVSFSSLLIVSLLKDDAGGLSCGKTVGGIAKDVICHCVADDPALFFRPFMERATNAVECTKCLDLLRLVVRHVTPLPPLCGHFLVNFLLAIVIHHSKNRTVAVAQEVISKALSILWMVVYACHSIDLKELKERLKKEYCDTDVLATSRVTTVERVTVRLPEGFFLSEVTISVTGETSFGAIITDALSRVGQTDDGSYCLVDPKADTPLVPTHYVADVFSRRREHREDFSLKLVQMRAEQSSQLEKLAFNGKASETSRVLFASSILSVCGQEGRSRACMKAVNFLHKELSCQKAFPRRAIDSDFDLFFFLQDKEGLYGCNKLHKHVWVRFVGLLFDGLSSTFEWGPEASLFLNVLNGAILLHHDDSALLRHTCATYINASRKFVNLFPLHGYEAILPALLGCYSSCNEGSLVRKSVEFTCRQFYNRHDVGFILQLLSSASHLLSASKPPFFAQRMKDHLPVSASSLLKLLVSLATTLPEDPLSIADAISILHLKGHHFSNSEFYGQGGHREMASTHSHNTIGLQERTTGVSSSHFGKTFPSDSVPDQKRFITAKPPLASKVLATARTKVTDLVEFGRLDVPFSMSECLRIIVSVIAFEADSVRGAEMLHVLKELMPYLTQLEAWKSLQVPMLTSIRALIRGCETLSRYTSLQRVPQADKCGRRASTFERPKLYAMQSAAFPRGSPAEESTENTSAGGVMADKVTPSKEPPSVMSRRRTAEFREPRNCLLLVICDFVKVKGSHLASMDATCLQILMKVAASLIKTASNSNDVDALDCVGLQRFFTEILPIMDWKSEKLQPLLVRLLDRVVKLLQRLDSNALRWLGLSRIFHGLYLVVQAQPTMARLPNMLRTMEELIGFLRAHQEAIAKNGGPTGTLFHMMKRLHFNVAPLTTLSDCMPPPKGDTWTAELKNYGTAVEKKLTSCMLFSEVVVQLLASQMSIMGSDFSLEYICGPLDQFSMIRRVNKHILATLLLPLCVRMGSGQPDAPKILHRDVEYALECILMTLSAAAAYGNESDPGRFNPVLPAMSMSSIGKKESISSGIVSDFPLALCRTYSSKKRSLASMAYQLMIVAYHGLKIVSVCFERQLGSRFHAIAHALSYAKVSRPLLGFLEFVLSSHSPLEAFLRPLIMQKLQECKSRGSHQEMTSRLCILLSQPDHAPPARSSLLCQLARELPALQKVAPQMQAHPPLTRQESDEGSVQSHEPEADEGPGSVTLGTALIARSTTEMNLYSTGRRTTGISERESETSFQHALPLWPLGKSRK